MVLTVLRETFQKSADPLRAVERVGVPLSICRSLFFYVFYSFLSFCSKVILLLITNLYQIPPKPSPAEANPSPEHPGGTRVEPGWDPLGSVKTRGNQKNDHLATPAGRLKVLFTDNI